MHFDDNHVFKDDEYAKVPLYVSVKRCGNITKLFVAMKENGLLSSCHFHFAIFKKALKGAKIYKKMVKWKMPVGINGSFHFAIRIC